MQEHYSNLSSSRKVNRFSKIFPQTKGSVYRPPFRQYERRYERNNCYQKREKNFHQDRLCKWTDSYQDRRPQSVEIDSSWSELQPRDEKLERELFAGVLSGKIEETFRTLIAQNRFTL